MHIKGCLVGEPLRIHAPKGALSYMKRSVYKHFFLNLLRAVELFMYEYAATYCKLRLFEEVCRAIGVHAPCAARPVRVQGPKGCPARPLRVHAPKGCPARPVRVYVPKVVLS